MSVAGYILTKEGNAETLTGKIYKSTDATTVGSTWSEVFEISDTLTGQGVSDIYVKSDTEIYLAAIIQDGGEKLRVYKSTDSGSSFTTQITVSSTGGPQTVRIVGNGTHICVVYESEKFIHTTDGSNWNERDLSSSGLNRSIDSSYGSRKILDVAVLSSTQAVLLVKGGDSGTTKITFIYLTAADSSSASNYTVDATAGIAFNGPKRIIGYSTSAIFVVGNRSGAYGVAKSTGLTAGSLTTTHNLNTSDTVALKAGTFVSSGALYITGGNPSKHVYYYEDLSATRVKNTSVLIKEPSDENQNLFAYNASNLFAVSRSSGDNYYQVLLSTDNGANFSVLTNTVGSDTNYEIKGFGFSAVSGGGGGGGGGKLTVKGSGKFTVKASGKITVK